MSERRRLPRERLSVTAKFEFGAGAPDIYAIVGLYDDGSPGEIFFRMGHVGGFERGVLNDLAVMISMSLQHGVPLETICEKLERTHYEPAGFVKGPPGIKKATSVGDALAQYFRSRWLDEESPHRWQVRSGFQVSREVRDRCHLRRVK